MHGPSRRQPPGHARRRCLDPLRREARRPRCAVPRACSSWRSARGRPRTPWPSRWSRGRPRASPWTISWDSISPSARAGSASTTSASRPPTCSATPALVDQLLDAGATAVVAEVGRRGRGRAPADRPLRPGARPVRPADRPVPGREASAGRDVRGHRVVQVPGLLRGLVPRRGPRGRCPRRLARQGLCSEAFARIGIDAVQLHGGIGYTWEYDAQLYLKRSKWARPIFGDADYHYERVAPTAREPRLEVDGLQLHARRGGLSHRGARASSTRTCPTERARLRRSSPSWQQKVREKRWVGFSWPKEVGGGGGSDRRAGDPQGGDGAGGKAPPLGTCFMGLAWVGPSHHPVRHRGAEAAASSPTSSTASTSGAPATPSPTRAATSPRSSARRVRDGDEYVVNGQKIWTSIAMWSKWMILLVRTDPSRRVEARRHHLPAGADGQRRASTVRPIKNMSGGTMFAEVFFDDVRVPVENRLGEEGRGLAGHDLGARPRALEHRRGRRACSASLEDAAASWRARCTQERPARRPRTRGSAAASARPRRADRGHAPERHALPHQAAAGRAARERDLGQQAAPRATSRSSSASWPSRSRAAAARSAADATPVRTAASGSATRSTGPRS